MAIELGGVHEKRRLFWLCDHRGDGERVREFGRSSRRCMWCGDGVMLGE